MNELIAVFRMIEISIDTRIRIMKKLGEALDNQYGMNFTGEIVKELTEQLEASRLQTATNGAPKNDISDLQYRIEFRIQALTIQRAMIHGWMAKNSVTRQNAQETREAEIEVESKNAEIQLLNDCLAALAPASSPTFTPTSTSTGHRAASYDIEFCSRCLKPQDQCGHCAEAADFVRAGK
jgi:hypothetical protein